MALPMGPFLYRLVADAGTIAMDLLLSFFPWVNPFLAPLRFKKQFANHPPLRFGLTVQRPRMRLPFSSLKRPHGAAR